MLIQFYVLVYFMVIIKNKKLKKKTLTFLYQHLGFKDGRDPITTHILVILVEMKSNNWLPGEWVKWIPDLGFKGGQTPRAVKKL